MARLGALSVDQIAARFEIGRSVAYEQVRRLIEAGLLERTQTLSGDPSLISATAQGIAYAGLGLPPAMIRIGEVDHWFACADVALELERRHGRENLLTERELRFQEQHSRRPIASAKLGETRNGYWRLHFPDLVVTAGGLPVAFEVELTPKSQKRLESIIRAWRRARHVERCIYLCFPGPTQQAVERAIRTVGARSRVGVVELRRSRERP